jgi:hypothetical protein
MSKPASSHMGVGRGRFRKALRAVLLSRHATKNLEALVRADLGWNCVYCGSSGEAERLQLDHLWPESKGGCLVIGNVVPACPTCNSDRREVSWRDFLRNSARVIGRRTEAEIESEISRITAYMSRYKQDVEPTLESMLTTDDLELLATFDELLSAVSDGALAKAGHVKKQAIRFKEPEKMFDELATVVAKYLK